MSPDFFDERLRSNDYERPRRDRPVARSAFTAADHPLGALLRRRRTRIGIDVRLWPFLAALGRLGKTSAVHSFIFECECVSRFECVAVFGRLADTRPAIFGHQACAEPLSKPAAKRIQFGDRFFYLVQRGARTVWCLLGSTPRATAPGKIPFAVKPHGRIRAGSVVATG